MKVGQNGFLRERFLDRFGDTKIDDFGHRFSILDRDQNVGGL